MEKFIGAALGLSSYKWKQVGALAADLRDQSILPVTGAGASLGCEVEPKVPSAPALASRLHQKVMSGEIPLQPRPRGFRELNGDLGDVAEAVCLQHEPGVMLTGLGLEDEAEWPPPEKIDAHACAYRVLARMARERLIEETLTFNYDCHNEAACMAEGFLERDGHTLGSQFWPSRYGVVATPAANADLTRRADFTVIKAHGCVECWRAEKEMWASGFSTAPDPNDAIVVRRSQLLDWRGNDWVRDLVSERARRHVLMLIGCSAEDPVIQISLKRIMDEVRKVDPDGKARIRALDIEPTTLSLRTVMKAAGVGPGPEDRKLAEIRVPGENRNHELGGMLIALMAEMTVASLQRFATPWARALPSARGPLTILLSVTAPIMARWSWWLLSKHRLGPMGLAVDLWRYRDSCYVPLLADPMVTLRAASTRQSLLARLGSDLESDLSAVRRAGFVVNDKRGAAAIPLGISPEEFEAATALLPGAVAELATPELELYAALSGEDPKQLHFYALPDGRRVTGVDAPF